MTTKLLSMLAGALVLFAPLVVAQGGGGQQSCDKQGITACHWGIAAEYRTLLTSADQKDSYLASLCNGNPQGLPENNHCKQDFYGSCTDAEKKKFARMERGYTVLRGEITSQESCQSVQQLHECMDLSAISSCDANPDFQGGTFEAQAEAKERGAQILKACIEKAIKLCNATKSAAAIAHLQKIVNAIVDLTSTSDKPNGAHTTEAATAVSENSFAKGGGGQQHCDKHGISACYWRFAEDYGMAPLVRSAEQKDKYLEKLCSGDPLDFPEIIPCKQRFYASCTDAEKKKFASMERGYAVLRGEITSAGSCQSVQQLRECMNLTAISSCDTIPNSEGGTFEAQAEAKERGARSLKVCIEKAIEPCDAKNNSAAIAHLQKIADAIVDFTSTFDKPNGAHTTKAAAAVVAVSLLSWIVRNFY
ncbi:uncharacterized protein [Dermacentor albipictus]|uniref:uncharacterized protein isoform X2 n=1 Tax=Dermacentor albipictus TaxID=60249 RepID=UPI0038FC7E54